MAIDKLVDSTQLDSDLASVADAIRAKSGGSSELDFPSEFVSEIESIPTGGSPTGTKQISINQNGTTTENVADYASAEINVNVPASEVDSGTKSISSNGTHDVTGYASASVAVPNSYASGDEGKVVSNGALVAQSSQNIDTNGTYDTTLKNEVVVNVAGGGGHARQAFYQKFYPAETYTQSNKLLLQLEPSDNCFILVRAVNYPTPDPTQYKALVWGQNRAYFNSNYTNSGTIHSILRPAGTIGTDGSLCSFNSSTGILYLGGEYGHFLPEDEYEVIQVVFE